MATYLEITDGRPDGAHVGQNASDLVAFHGATPVDQAAFIATVTVSNTITVLASTVNSILALLAEKGLMAAS